MFKTRPVWNFRFRYLNLFGISGFVLRVFRLVGVAVITSFWPGVVLAQVRRRGATPPGNVSGGGGLTGPIQQAAEGFKNLNKTQVVNFIVRFSEWLIGLIVVIAVVMILWGAFQYTTSAGSEEKMKNAQKTLLWGVIGTMVALVAFSAVTFARSFLVP